MSFSVIIFSYFSKANKHTNTKYINTMKKCFFTIFILSFFATYLVSAQDTEKIKYTPQIAQIQINLINSQTYAKFSKTLYYIVISTLGRNLMFIIIDSYATL